MDPTILYVDDQQENLDGLRFTFRKNYKIFTALTAAEGFKILEENEISIVISDQRMPDILGTEFLNQVSEKYPYSIRIILTAFADFDAVVGAINKGQVYRFLTKPWDRDEMRMTIENAHEAYLLRKENLKLIEDLRLANENLNSNNILLQKEIEERKIIARELQDHRDNLELIVTERTKELAATNEELGAINEELKEVNERISVEIEQRKVVQQSLVESEKKFRSFVEQSSQGASLFDRNGKILEWNRSMDRILGSKREELYNIPVWESDAINRLQYLNEEGSYESISKKMLIYITNIDKAKPAILEAETTDLAGGKKYILLTLFPIITDSMAYIGGFVSDMTERRKAEEEILNQATALEELNAEYQSLNEELNIYNEELRKHRDHLEELVEIRTRELLTTEARLQTLSDNLPGGAIFNGFTDKQGLDHLVYASRGLEEITGIASENLKDSMSPFFDRIHPDDIARFLENRAASQKTNSTLDIIFRYNKQENEIRWLQIRTIYAIEKKGSIQWDGYIIDITERRQSEEQSKEREIIFRNLQELIAPVTGEKLFDTLLLNIQEIIHIYFLFVAEYIPETRKLRTLSFTRDREIHENFEYSVENTPSEKILEDDIVAFNNNIIQAFPKDEILVKEMINGYIGVSLRDSEGKPIGVVVASAREELFNLEFAIQILRVFSVRIGAELIRIQKDRELKERETRFSTLFDLSPNMEIITRMDGTIVEANNTFLLFTGLSRDETIGSSTVKLKLWDEEDSERLKAEFRQKGRIHNFAAYFRPRKGKKRHLLLSQAPILIKGEQYIISSGIDITDRILAEQKLAESEEKFRLIVEGQSDLIIKLDAEQKFIFASPSYCEYFNKKEKDLIGMNYLPVINPDDLEATRNSIKAVFSPPYTSSVEHRVETSDGWKWLAWSNKAINNEKGELTGIISVGRDITEKKNTEETMRASEERFRSILQNLSDSIWIVDINSIILYESPSAVNMLSYKEGELLGKTGFELIHPDDLPEVMRDFTKAINNQDDGDPTLFRLLTGNGKYIFVEAISNNQINHKAIRGIIITLRNVTERISKDRALRESEQKFRNIFNSSTDAIIISSLDQKILEVNEVVAKLSGFSREELLSMKTTDLATEKFRADINKRFVLLSSNELVPPTEIDFVIKSGEILATEMTSRLIDYEGEKALLTLVRDITERKKLEKVLIDTIIQTEEKERERMAADLHDEVGPLLSSMKMYLNSLVETKDSSKSLYIADQLQLLIKESITAVREISNDLSPHILNNYGLSAAVRAAVDTSNKFINIMLNETLENNRFSSNIEIVFYRIIRELMNNTIKHAAAKKIEISLFQVEDKMILYYSDNGNGFDWQKVINSTRRGLGLMNILSRVKSMNGHYTIQTAPGKGFYFELTAPL